MDHLQDICFDGERLEPGPRHARGDLSVDWGAATSTGHTPADAKPEKILLERRGFHVRLASTRGRRSKSSMLVNRMYAWRGYTRTRRNEAASNVNQITLQACREQAVFGTLSLSFDSDAGLAADALYRSEIDAYRRAGAKVCEITQLAIDPEYGSKDVLGALFHLAYIFGGLLRGATDVFIEVNPRHVLFYKRMLDFSEAGPCKICERVNAPAVLLHLSAAHVAKQIALYGGQKEEAKRSLYPYFFSPQEEEGLAGRIATLSGAITKACV